MRAFLALVCISTPRNPCDVSRDVAERSGTACTGKLTILAASGLPPMPTETRKLPAGGAVLELQVTGVRSVASIAINATDHLFRQTCGWHHNETVGRHHHAQSHGPIVDKQLGHRIGQRLRQLIELVQIVVVANAP